MQQLLTGKKRFSKFAKNKKMKNSRYGLIPEDWDIIHIRDIAKVNSHNLPNSTDPKYEFYYIDLNAVKKGKAQYAFRGRQ